MRIALILVLLFGAVVSGWTQVPIVQPPRDIPSATNAAPHSDFDFDKVQVRLNMSGSDDQAKDIAKSYITRELRKISDIQLSDSFGFLTLGCIVTTIHNKLGDKTGYVISWVVTTQATNILALQVMKANHVDSDTVQKLLHLLSSEETYVTHSVTICGPDDLETTLSEDVATLDSTVIEQARKRLKVLNFK